jgi:hypothetical protein
VPGKPAPKQNRSGRRGDARERPHPLTAEQLVRGIFQIAPEDVKKVLASKPGKGKKSKPSDQGHA